MKSKFFLNFNLIMPREKGKDIERFENRKPGEKYLRISSTDSIELET